MSIIENKGRKMECIIASTKELPLGKMMSFTNDGKEILIANLDDKYYAIENKCAHRGCKLSGGVLNGSNIECPCHGSIFDVKTGNVVKGPAKKAKPTFKIGVKENQIVVDY